ncbi:hypothetical protein T8K17_11350 [Thalassobaculum sp. OXR-137]|uniref:hypothetical protein n=1 Tax=Thalassobaculum sp. OXR-137 TaxID=3100173 RepID=UPI002AC945ED|nr:hypothetical protein [Thalassobaculum sp. OXR-137]WPZ36730.1 hypothetical protein T8K17_11350 [Thalassobaculum sp. OXR-137]
MIPYAKKPPTPVQNHRSRFAHHPLEVCEDCNGWIEADILPHDRPTLPADIDRIWPKADGWDIIASNGMAGPGFTWLPCQCCGSTLGGLRYPAIAFREEYPGQ